ncbi:aspartate--tRNA ligase [Megamonas hypermegale]|uniref:Aspartate--tRNA(Asp/Asn) ligase n=1 Tax=Megamonas hypermegale TaxID=158847 RepID=A0A921L7G2_9FIRM|nr:aspartate--tRNA ligase [Megamonas hypermegale]MDM8142275.1 aspartate--tRNA ligase [Megamonas hypermegale]HJF84477.1 aspartate--tRNA ligase [Megamonas hypermegale]
METMEGMKRTHHCGELRAQNEGQEVVVCGWVSHRRDHGGLIFIDLRDRSGLVQLVFAEDKIGADQFPKAESLRSEFVVAVRGKVCLRDKETINPNMETGEIEIYAEELRILNKAMTPPFYIQDGVDVDENVRLKYRYLDLRRPEMQKNIMLRHRVAKLMRDYMDKHGFLEIETPMLTKSTPEGARDYLVPSRVNPGKFYALPQSPQIFKQLLMVAGYEKYFQIVRCFRDEDLRADRQPEFTQLDIEMSFVDQEYILTLMEGLMQTIFETIGEKVQAPFLRMTWDEAMERYGSDKPDIRFGMELMDISEYVKGSDFKVFKSVLDNGGQVKVIKVDGYANIPRRELDGLVEYAQRYGAKGLAWIQYTEKEIKSPFKKFYSEETFQQIKEATNAKTGDLLLVVADKPLVVAQALGELRLEMGRRRGLINENEYKFLWVVDFPMFEYDEENKRWKAMHHPFTAPRDEDVQYLLSDPGRVKAKAYDMVLNGVEVGGGSLRIYNSDTQEKVFEAIGLTPEEAHEKFGFMLDAFKYGTPPHGGLAFGLDRLIMLMAKRASIRDVIPFPKTQSASCLMTQAPSEVDAKQLRELSIRTAVAAKKKPESK